jgi:Protein of unknown function (DUF1194)
MQYAKHILAAMVALATAAGAAQANEVDVELVLAVDTSGSIDAEEYQIQHEGYAAAFSSDNVVAAIQSGPLQRIAVTFVEWSGSGHQKQLVPWTLIEDKASAIAFAEAIKAAPRSYSDWTSLSDAIDFSAKLYENEYDGLRLVLDISGDGINNNGRPVIEARDEAVARGIIINGLPILNEDPALGTYFDDNVIGGPGAFKVAVKDFDSFTDALMSKLVREIAGITQGEFDYAGLD